MYQHSEALQAFLCLVSICGRWKAPLDGRLASFPRENPVIIQMPATTAAL